MNSTTAITTTSRMLITRISCPLLLLCAFLSPWISASAYVENTARAVIADTIDASPEVRALVKALSDAAPDERALAACELGDLGDEASSAVPYLLAAMQDEAKVRGDICHEKKWGRAVRGNYEHEPVTVGRKAAAALTDLVDSGMDGVRLKLIGTLKSDNTETRRNAAWSMGALDAEDSIVQLNSMVSNDPQSAVRSEAAWALGAIGKREGVEGLLDGVLDTEDEVRAQSAWALGAIGHSSGASALIGLLSDPVAEIREQAAWALGAIGSTEGVTGLVAALRDNDRGVRAQAAWALGAIGDSSAEKDLLRVVQEDGSKDVRRQALWAISVM